MNRLWIRSLVICSAAAFLLAATQQQPAASLPSWNDGASKKAIVDFVARVTKEGTPDFVPPAERIAVFDNDGTLWCEQPLYFQGFFCIDRIKALAPQHPEWKDTEPFKSALAGDLKGVAAAGAKGLHDMMAATHSGMTTDEFNAIVKDWIRTARHPKYNRPYTECVYQPMLEVLTYLRGNGFKTYIVSGGGIDFMRAFAEEVYGIPPEQIIGTSGKTKLEMRDGAPVIVKEAELNSLDDKEGKPLNIELHIGRRPVMCFGNSDGDLQMLQWTTIPRGSDDHSPRFGAIVHHTDAEREYAYDRESHVGKLDKALDEAAQRGWTVVSMKEDWKTIYPATATGGGANAGANDNATTGDSAGAAALENTTWRLVELNGKPATPSPRGPGAQITLVSRDHTIAANTSINSLSGEYSLSGGRLTIAPGAMTKMAGPEPLMQQERAFIAALRSAKSFRIKGDTLELLDGETVLAKFKAGDGA